MDCFAFSNIQQVNSSSKSKSCFSLVPSWRSAYQLIVSFSRLFCRKPSGFALVRMPSFASLREKSGWRWWWYCANKYRKFTLWPLKPVQFGDLWRSMDLFWQVSLLFLSVTAIWRQKHTVLIRDVSGLRHQCNCLGSPAESAVSVS